MSWRALGVFVTVVSLSAVGACESDTPVETATEGALAVAIVGLPEGGLADAHVTGPGGFSRVLQGTETLTGLVVGRYRITATAVHASDVNYEPATVESFADVAAGSVASAAVTYLPIDATLRLTLLGLPAGILPDIRLVGPDGYERVIDQNVTVTGLLPGGYVIESSTARVNGFAHRPSNHRRSIQLLAGSRESLLLTYSTLPLDASITVTLQGLPAGASPIVTIAGPAGAAYTLPGGGTVTDIEAGRYLVGSPDVEVGGEWYSPRHPEYAVVLAGGGAAEVVFVYSRPDVTASLTVWVDGFPTRESGKIEVIDPAGVLWKVIVPWTMPNAIPGRHTVLAHRTLVDGAAWEGSPTTHTVDIAEGANVTTRVRYTPIGPQGQLELRLEGLPDRIRGDVAIEGPYGFYGSVDTTTTISVQPGDYSIISRAVAGTDTTYAPERADAIVRVPAGGVGALTIQYAKGPGVVRPYVITLDTLRLSGIGTMGRLRAQLDPTGDRIPVNSTWVVRNPQILHYFPIPNGTFYSRGVGATWVVGSYGRAADSTYVIVSEAAPSSHRDQP